jgi:hypothetical protein
VTILPDALRAMKRPTAARYARPPSTCSATRKLVSAAILTAAGDPTVLAPFLAAVA